ncbi:hypothetical protein, partial [Kibdelosporangium persicum]|uniref:hypothetical protein n=1 Tax=Kibdelosporangium persicum TaxID=2698649 RepID=UPI0039F0B569
MSRSFSACGGEDREEQRAEDLDGYGGDQAASAGGEFRDSGADGAVDLFGDGGPQRVARFGPEHRLEGAVFLRCLDWRVGHAVDDVVQEHADHLRRWVVHVGEDGHVPVGQGRGHGFLVREEPGETPAAVAIALSKPSAAKTCSAASSSCAIRRSPPAWFPLSSSLTIGGHHARRG